MCLFSAWSERVRVSFASYIACRNCAALGPLALHRLPELLLTLWGDFSLSLCGKKWDRVADRSWFRSAIDLRCWHSRDSSQCMRVCVRVCVSICLSDPAVLLEVDAGLGSAQQGKKNSTQQTSHNFWVCICSIDSFSGRDCCHYIQTVKTKKDGSFFLQCSGTRWCNHHTPWIALLCHHGDEHISALCLTYFGASRYFRRNIIDSDWWGTGSAGKQVKDASANSVRELTQMKRTACTN